MFGAYIAHGLFLMSMNTAAINTQETLNKSLKTRKTQMPFI